MASHNWFVAGIRPLGSSPEMVFGKCPGKTLKSAPRAGLVPQSRTTAIQEKHAASDFDASIMVVSFGRDRTNRDFRSDPQPATIAGHSMQAAHILSLSGVPTIPFLLRDLGWGASANSGNALLPQAHGEAYSDVGRMSSSACESLDDWEADLTGACPEVDGDVDPTTMAKRQKSQMRPPCLGAIAGIAVAPNSEAGIHTNYVGYHDDSLRSYGGGYSLSPDG